MSYYCPKCNKLLLLNEQIVNIQKKFICGKCDSNLDLTQIKLNFIAEKIILNYKKLFLIFCLRIIFGLAFFLGLYFFYKKVTYNISLFFILFPVIFLLISLFLKSGSMFYNFNKKSSVGFIVLDFLFLIFGIYCFI